MFCQSRRAVSIAWHVHVLVYFLSNRWCRCLRICLPVKEAQKMQIPPLGQKIPWRREWQPTPVFLPGESLDREALWATVHGVTKSWTRLNLEHAQDPRNRKGNGVYWRRVMLHTDHHHFCKKWSQLIFSKMWFTILLNSNIHSAAEVSRIYHLPSCEYQSGLAHFLLPTIFSRSPPNGFISTDACPFNTLKNSIHLKQLGLQRGLRRKPRHPCFAWEGGWVFSVKQMPRTMRWHVSHIPSWNRQCSSLSSKKVALFRIMWHPNRRSSGGSIGKESISNAGDMGSISGLGMSLEEGNGNPLQYACLGNPMDRGSWQRGSVRLKVGSSRWTLRTGHPWWDSLSLPHLQQ